VVAGVIRTTLGAVGEGIVTSASEAAAHVAAIVRRRSEPDFVPMLRQADQHFDGDGAFELTLAQTLRADSALVDLWETWSTDQRWTPSAYFEGTEVGWFDGARRHVQIHLDHASAAADFVHRLAAWLASSTAALRDLLLMVTSRLLVVATSRG